MLLKAHHIYHWFGFVVLKNYHYLQDQGNLLFLAVSMPWTFISTN